MPLTLFDKQYRGSVKGNQIEPDRSQVQLMRISKRSGVDMECDL